MNYRTLALKFALLTTMTLQSAPAPAATFSVEFDDPTNVFDGYYEALESSILGAAHHWDQYLQGQGAIEIVLRPDFSLTTAAGGSVTSWYSHFSDGYYIYEWGMAIEIRTGIDFNGAVPDVEFYLSPDYLFEDLWFDPDPIARTEPIPPSGVDAVSVWLHEFGHALVFNGWIDDVTGEFPADYKSRFDEWIDFDGDNFYFTGPEAMSVYGGPVPLTWGNQGHLANDPPRPGADLIPDLMNGVIGKRGERDEISALDLAILRDCGVEVVPEPAGITLMLLGAVLSAGWVARRKT